jgi:hypothetical protein
MKRLLLLASIAFLTSMSANAQCTPDPQYTNPGVFPDSATGLSTACADQLYEELITIVVPVDTTAQIGPIPITMAFDSVVISDWQGLPNGFTYSCYDSGNMTSPADGCAFEGNTTGCVLISGTPTMAQIGSHQQIITTDAYLNPNPLGNPAETIVDYYYIHIVDCTNGLNMLADSKFLVYPNPAKSTITLNGLNDVDVESIAVIDMNGKVLEYFEGVVGPALDMDINYLESGMYYVQVNYNGTQETIKFIKE